MSHKRVVPNPNVLVKSNPKLNIPMKVETNPQNIADFKLDDESLFASNLTNIIQSEASHNPSPLLKQHIMDLLQELPDTVVKVQSGPVDENNLGLVQPMQGLRLFQFTKQEETENILKEQISSLKRDLDIKNILIEKLMKENNNLKNEIGELLAIDKRTTKTTDLKAKEAAEKINQFQEEIKSLKLELSNYKQIDISKKVPNIGSEFSQLQNAIECYHEDNSKRFNSFVSQLNTQVSDFMQDVQKKHERLNHHIQDFKKYSQNKKSQPERTKEQPKVAKLQLSNQKVPLLREERTTPKSRTNKTFKKEIVLRSYRTFEFDDDSKTSLTGHRAKIEKCHTERTDESFDLRTAI